MLLNYIQTIFSPATKEQIPMVKKHVRRHFFICKRLIKNSHKIAYSGNKIWYSNGNEHSTQLFSVDFYLYCRTDRT